MTWENVNRDSNVLKHWCVGTAFVSFVRGYKEHQCKFIFESKKLDLGALGNGFGLLHLPKMPELKKEEAYVKFVKSDINQNEIRFVDKAREKARKEALKKQESLKATRGARQEKKPSVAAWSKQTEQKDRREKRKSKKEYVRSLKEAKVPKVEEWDEEDLAFEARLAKKLRQGKITKQQYKAELAERAIMIGEADLYGKTGEIDDDDMV